jgi:hypothetical protein
VGRIELIALLIAISFVLIAEMINSALEAGIDVATTSFDPLAKLAKDIAAGAVLIATVNAVAVGYLVFSDVFVHRSSRLIERLRTRPAELTVIALVLTIILVLATKAYTDAARRYAAGLPVGHAAVAFGGWMAVTQVVGDSEHWFLITSLTFLMCAAPRRYADTSRVSTRSSSRVRGDSAALVSSSSRCSDEHRAVRTSRPRGEGERRRNSNFPRRAAVRARTGCSRA